MLALRCHRSSNGTSMMWPLLYCCTTSTHGSISGAGNYYPRGYDVVPDPLPGRWHADPSQNILTVVASLARDDRPVLVPAPVSVMPRQVRRRAYRRESWMASRSR